MATQWILGKVSDAVAPVVSGAVSSAGGFAGGAINAVGNGVNSVGEGFNRTVKTYGDGVKDYGNSVMDWTSATSVRGATAANPLGLTGSTTSGKRSTTSPSEYYAPKQTPNKTATPQKEVGAAPTKKALPAPQPKPAAKSQPAKSQPAKTQPAKTTTNAAKKPSATGKKTISPSAKPGPRTAPKAAPASAPKPAQKSNYGTPKTASNPLGLS